VKRRWIVVVLLVLGLPYALHALTRSYAVDPVQASWSGLADPEDGVSEVLVCAFDEPVTASLFCGSRGGDGTYTVRIYAYPNPGLPFAQRLGVAPPPDHQWLTCSLDVVYSDSFIKGRRIEVRWTRSGQDSMKPDC
jgi:hypothetical protein